MATRTGPSKAQSVGTAVLEQLADLDFRSISPETARKLLEFRFDDFHQERVNALAEKARQGRLTAAEEDDLDEYIRVGTLLGILQSKTRQVLKNAGRQGVAHP